MLAQHEQSQRQAGSKPMKLGGAVGGPAVELLDGPAPGVKVVAKPTNETTDGQRIKETDK